MDPDQIIGFYFLGLSQEADYLVSGLSAVVTLVVMGCLNTTTCRGVGIRIERHSDELLFDLEYKHPWLDCCSTDAANYDNLDRRRSWGSARAISISSDSDEESPPVMNPHDAAPADVVTQIREETQLLTTN